MAGRSRRLWRILGPWYRPTGRAHAGYGASLGLGTGPRGSPQVNVSPIVAVGGEKVRNWPNLNGHSPPNCDIRSLALGRESPYRRCLYLEGLGDDIISPASILRLRLKHQA
jgi:hypothetical protein